jgi:type II secretory pathway pseudopilin PulG
MSERGASIIQVLVGLSLISVVTLGVVHSLSQSKSAWRQTEIKKNAEVVQKLLTTYVSDANLCSTSLRIRDAGPGVTAAQLVAQAQTTEGLPLVIRARLPGLNENDDPVLGDVGEVPGNINTVLRYNLQIRSIVLKAKADPVGSPPKYVVNYTEAGSPRTRLSDADLVISVQSTLNNQLPLAPRKSRMQVVIDDTGNIISCNAAIDPAQYCRDLGGDYNALRNPPCAFRPADILDCKAAPGQPWTYIKDFDPVTGNPICAEIPTLRCPPGQFLMGYNELGQPFCEAASLILPLLVNGVCGTANGASFVDQAALAASNLCIAGTPSAISGTGPWSWQCTGSNGGTNSNCTATLSAPPVACNSPAQVSQSLACGTPQAISWLCTNLVPFMNPSANPVLIPGATQYFASGGLSVFTFDVYYSAGLNRCCTYVFSEGSGYWDASGATFTAGGGVTAGLGHYCGL